MSEAKERITTSPTEPHVSSGDRWFMILLTVFEIGASIITVNYVKDHGGSDFQAYMWSLVPPAIGAVIYYAKTRDLSRASLAILAFNLLSALAAALGSHDSRVLLYKDCFVTGIIGLIFAGSLLMSRPLTFWFGQRFVTGGEPQALAWWDSLWQYKQFRDTQRQITAVWAVVMFVEAGAKALVIKNTSFKDAYALTQVLPLAATAIGIASTIMLARRSQRAGQAAREARLGGSCENSPGSVADGTSMRKTEPLT